MYPVFYKEIAAIDKQKDAALKVQPVQDYAFAKNDYVLPVFTDEIIKVAGDYPVVFTTHDTPVMVTVLGHGGNNMVDGQGAWREGKYIPAVVRAYPFAALPDNTGNLVFCIDRLYSGINPDGTPVFDEDGAELSPFGKNAAGFVNAYADAYRKTGDFSRKLKELDLFTPVNVTVDKDGIRYNFTGLQQVDLKKLSEVPAEELKSMVASGMMYHICLHLYSLNNFNKVV